MNFTVQRKLLLGLFAFAAMGSASATPMQAPAPAVASQFAATAAPVEAAANPWPTVLSVADSQPETLLAHDDRDDRHWHDRRGDWRRDQWRKEQWRREQHRREMERRHDWERRHDRAMRHRYEADHRYYRR
ncbi:MULTISPECIES: hypothetical protein [Pseudomonas]|uniref:Uncharacterized protein n=1 Tax=Pseudomonas hunanensis TaxID=1247546 RepID=A0ACC6JZE3_9PSED|nr:MULTISPECIES: hypothetical protein [Pseudomonas]MBP2261797.1 hypothetical protein [Pseudomonas sp. BP8]MDR6711564.1 hypothetical protein [Pseudomonas hunanensis]HDS1736725.1 hypothetical protein [Pseudomonas putida]